MQSIKYYITPAFLIRSFLIIDNTKDTFISIQGLQKDRKYKNELYKIMY